MRRLTISGKACAQTLSLLVAMAWADGRLEENEKAGVRDAASVLNLTRELREQLEELLDKPQQVGSLPLSELSAKERAFAYVAAAWMARVDETVASAEAALLDEVQGALELSDARAEELRQIAAELPLEMRETESWAAQLTHLFRAIPKHMEHDEDLELEVV